jgi:hypothetical protein
MGHVPYSTLPPPLLSIAKTREFAEKVHQSLAIGHKRAYTSKVSDFVPGTRRGPLYHIYN